MASPDALDARIVAIAVAYNEEKRIGAVLDRMRDVAGVDAAVVDDGSTDATPAIVRDRHVHLITRETRGGAGAAIRSAYAWARARGYDVCVIMAGNDKDRPSDIARLIAPIVRGEADLVQGSRYLPGGTSPNTPWTRRFATRWMHPWLFSLVARQRMTDTTNGFRALRLSLLDDPRLDLRDSWLDGYELEPYLLLNAIALGYIVREVGVTKVYPGDGERYTKMRGVFDWWGIVKPLVFALGPRLLLQGQRNGRRRPL